MKLIFDKNGSFSVLFFKWLFMRNGKKVAVQFLTLFLMLFNLHAIAKDERSNFKVIAFYTAKSDLAHISFVHEANAWFPKMANKYGFIYDSTNDWNNMNDSFLARYQVILFLDTRPEAPVQRLAFQHFMENGGGWMGFHFSAFALTPSAYPQNWDWYHQTFLGSGQYISNTWRPTTAVLRVENPKHPAVKHLPATFKSAPCEWYRWENDLRKNPDIQILLSIDSSSFPLGTGPKQSEIWHSGYYPVAWTNKNYKMIYLNMGHNDMDYEGKTNKTLSFTLENEFEEKFILDGLKYLTPGPSPQVERGAPVKRSL